MDSILLDPAGTRSNYSPQTSFFQQPLIPGAHRNECIICWNSLKIDTSLQDVTVDRQVHHIFFGLFVHLPMWGVSIFDFVGVPRDDR